MSVKAGSRNEKPFYVQAGGADVFGIVTEPTTAAKGVGVIILTGGSYIGATNRNRVSVRLARRLAEIGYHAVRMDYHGVGDSSGELLAEYRLDSPFVDDLLAVVRLLEDQGVGEFAFVGSTCFGSRTALAATARVPALRGVVLSALPLRDWLDVKGIQATPAKTFARRALSGRVWRGLRDRKRRQRYLRVIRTKLTSAFALVGRRALGRAVIDPAVDFVTPHVMGPLASLAKRRTPTLLVYGSDEPFYEDFCTARRGRRLSELFDASDSVIDVRVVPDGVHNLVTLDCQEDMMAAVVDWLGGLPARVPSPA